MLQEVPRSRAPPVRAQAFSGAAFEKHAVRRRVLQDVAAMPTPPWDASVHEHCEEWTTAVRESLVEQCGQPSRRTRQTFLAASTLALVEVKRWVQRQLRASRRRATHRSSTEQEAEQPLTDLLAAAEGVLAKAVREQVAVDRDSFLNKLGDEVAQTSHRRNAADLWRSLRAVLPTRRNQRLRVQPLPWLMDETGQPATSLEERGRIWQRRFCELEAGRIVAASLLAQECADRQAAQTAAQPEDLRLDVADVLSLAQWRNAVSHGQRGRATGPDALPA